MPPMWDAAVGTRNPQRLDSGEESYVARLRQGVPSLWGVAQLAERPAVTREVAGSKPAAPAYPQLLALRVGLNRRPSSPAPSRAGYRIGFFTPRKRARSASAAR